MTKRTRRLFSAEFKLEAAQLVLAQNFSVTEEAQAMNVQSAQVKLNTSSSDFLIPKLIRNFLI
ncbi:transposase [Vibrio sp. PNB23_22_6]